MGAAVAVEILKPVDASDIIEAGSLDFAKSEIKRLRSELGHLADQYGVQVVDKDLKDLITGTDDIGDFNRCVQAISHIRACLKLNTQTSRRKTRYNSTIVDVEAKNNIEHESDSESSSDDEAKM